MAPANRGQNLQFCLNTRTFSIFPLSSTTEADLAVIILFDLLYEADFAAILPVILLYEVDFVFILPLVMLCEPDLTAILLFLLLYDAGSAVISSLIPPCENYSDAILPSIPLL